MKGREFLPALLFLAFLALIASSVVFGQSPEQYYGGPGGVITGYVIGVNGYPVDWAQIHASSDNQTFQAFSGMSGLYRMNVPAGTYNLTVFVPGYAADSAAVNVTDGSTAKVDFRLRRAETPVPEFPASMIAVVLGVAFAVLVMKARYAKR